MAKLKRLVSIGIVSETTQGTPVAVGATDFLWASDVSIEPMFEMLEQDYYRSYLDPVAAVAGKRNYKVSFKTPLRGSGTRGTALAPLGAAIKACAFSEAATPATSVIYTPVSAPASANFFTPGTSCTIEVYLDGLKHVIAGCAGNMKITFPAGKYAVLEFEFSGIWATPSDTAPGTETYNATLPPIVQSATFTIHSFAAVIAQLEIDCGNEVVERPSVNAATSLLGFMVTGKKPTAKIDAEVATIAAHDVIDRINDNTEGTLAITVGATSGNINAISCPKAQYTGRKYGDRNGLLIGQDEIRLNGSAGNDFLVLTCT
jgi:hypothetical protein